MKVLVLAKFFIMLLVEKTRENLDKKIGQEITIFTKKNPNPGKIYKGILGDYTLWNFIEITLDGMFQGYVPFLGHYEGIQKIEDSNGNIIFENKEIEKIVFPEVDFKPEEEKKKVTNEFRMLCFGPGHDLP